jgi:hypothetical protein
MCVIWSLVGVRSQAPLDWIGMGLNFHDSIVVVKGSVEYMEAD